MEGIIMTAQLLLGLSILVGLHELGHLLAAKAFGMRVEKYSIGFPPKIWGKKFGETEYSFGAIPLGGFVKISGMIDESMDVKSMSAEPQPWEFRSKPAWQRLIVMMGGIIVNVITGIIIFIVIVFSNGESYVPKQVVIDHGIFAYPLGEQIGFKTGDRVINVNGQDYDRFSDLVGSEIMLGDNGFYTVERAGEKLTVPIPNDFLDRMIDSKDEGFIAYRFPFSVGRVPGDMNAAKAGIEEGDIIKRINDQAIDYFNELKPVLETFKGDTVIATITRDKQELDIPVLVSEDATLGFQAKPEIQLAHQDYSLGMSVVKGTQEAFGVVFTNIKAFGKMFKGDVSVGKSLSGPIGIAQIFGGTWDWGNFWRITGLLSMVLAFMNFLPIPALDGGHVMFLTYEIVSGRKPSDKFLENAQKIGMVLLLGLMSYAIFNDVYKLF